MIKSLNVQVGGEGALDDDDDDVPDLVENFDEASKNEQKTEDKDAENDGKSDLNRIRILVESTNVSFPFQTMQIKRTRAAANSRPEAKH